MKGNTLCFEAAHKTILRLEVQLKDILQDYPIMCINMDNDSSGVIHHIKNLCQQRREMMLTREEINLNFFY